jgi:uncharacterized membrane protein
MSRESRTVAGILLVVMPTAVFGGVSLLSMIIGQAPGYLDNQVRQDLWRAGHAHAAVLLILSLVMLRYVDEANLSPGWRRLARLGVPIAAVLMPAAFFLSVLSPQATEPNGLIYLAFVGAALIVAALLTLGIGLLRARGPA